MSTQTHTPHEAAVLKLIQHIGRTPEKTQYLLDWMAAPLRPGPPVKLSQVMLLKGGYSAANILQQSLADIYHEEALSTGIQALADPRHVVPTYVRLLTVYDRSSTPAHADSLAAAKAYLKCLISNPERNAGTTAYPLPTPNRLNIIFCTGAADPFNTEDRRFFVVQEAKPLQLTSDEDYLLSYSNRLERAVALKNLLRRHQITPGFA